MIRIHPSLIEERDSGGPLIPAIVTLAHDLGISVIADHIGSDRHLAIARRYNIDYVQGDFISPPVDAAEVKALLSRQQLVADAAHTT
jgi:EAL domain-containing protein (putative c-di-GMP-specific phosphodiesterase class I)